MFLLISVRHVGAHPGGHLHGVSIQISINLGKTFLRLSLLRNIPLTWILARVFAHFPPFISEILDFLYGVCFLFWSILNVACVSTKEIGDVCTQAIVNGVTLKASNPYWEDYISCCSLKPQPRLSPRLLDLSMIFSMAYKRGKVFRKVSFFCTGEIELTSK